MSATICTCSLHTPTISGSTVTQPSQPGGSESEPASKLALRAVALAMAWARSAGCCCVGSLLGGTCTTSSRIALAICTRKGRLRLAMGVLQGKDRAVAAHGRCQSLGQHAVGFQVKRERLPALAYIVQVFGRVHGGHIAPLVKHMHIGAAGACMVLADADAARVRPRLQGLLHQVHLGLFAGLAVV